MEAKDPKLTLLFSWSYSITSSAKRKDIWVPQELSVQTMVQIVTITVSILAHNKTDPFLNRIITVDKNGFSMSMSRKESSD